MNVYIRKGTISVVRAIKFDHAKWLYQRNIVYPMVYGSMSSEGMTTEYPYVEGYIGTIPIIDGDYIVARYDGKYDVFNEESFNERFELYTEKGDTVKKENIIQFPESGRMGNIHIPCNKPYSVVTVTDSKGFVIASVDLDTTESIVKDGYVVILDGQELI